MNKNFGIIELYCGASGKIGFYNNQELGICKAMTKLGYNCFVFYPDVENNDILEEKYDNTVVVRCPAKHIGVHSFYDWNILKKYNISYAQIDSDNQLFAPYIIRFCKKNDIKCYNYIGTIKSDSDNSIKNFISSAMTIKNIEYYKRSKCFVKTKQVLFDMNKKGVKDVNIVRVGLDLSLIPEVSSDIEGLKRELNVPADRKILLFVGRMENYKKPFEMLKILRNVNNDYFGIMIGTGSLSSEIDNVIANELNGKVIRIDKIENTKIHQYYKISDYFLNFNEKEIFGMSMLEAIYQSCNVIAIKSPGAEEIIKDCFSGFIVDGNEEMLKIIKKGEKLSPTDMRNEIVNHFSWDNNVKAFDKYLHGIEKPM